MTTMNGPRIAHFSFGDINNYGDILFAHVFGMEMRRRLPGVHIDHFAPTTAAVDGVAYQAYLPEQVDGRYDALVLAGGEVVHFFDDRTWRPLYAKLKAQVPTGRPSDVVWDWVRLEAKFKAWMSVGVRPFEDQLDQERLNAALNALDHCSVRGVLSKKILEGGHWGGNDRRISVSPDLGWLFPKYLDHRGARGKHYKDIAGDRPYALFQVNSITEEQAGGIADQLRRFQDASGARVLLIPVIHPWEDVKYLRWIEARGEGELELLSDRLSVLQMADLMVHAQVVLCSSLHTAITAWADGVPAAVINKWQGTKLQDLVGHQFRSDLFANDHAATFELLSSLWKERAHPETLEAYGRFMRSALSDAFDHLADRVQMASGR